MTRGRGGERANTQSDPRTLGHIFLKKVGREAGEAGHFGSESKESVETEPVIPGLNIVS